MRRSPLPRSCSVSVCAALLLGALSFSSSAGALGSFVTFESGQVRPLALSPDGSRLYAVNTPDNRLEIFEVSAAGLRHQASVAVGMEPVAVAARSRDEVWVVNHLSDSVSIVDVAATPPRVTRTLLVGDEPRDLVFAGPRENDAPGGPFTRAFVTTAHRGQNSPLSSQLTTPGVGRADVWVFDTAQLGASLGGDPLEIVTLFGDTPRALAASPDGARVYAAVFHSGNQTTILPEGVVPDGNDPCIAAPPCRVRDLLTLPGGPPRGEIPPGLPPPRSNLDGVPGPEVGLVVRFDPESGLWRDELDRNWNNAVRFDLPDLDVFAIDAGATPPVEVASWAHVGTILFNMAVNPANGHVYVSNTEAHNEVRFEGPGSSASTVRGRLHEARITILDDATALPRHLNKHIDYAAVPTPAGTAERSLATPLGMAVSSDGHRLYLAAFGSSKVGIFETDELEQDRFAPDPDSHIAVSGGGPTGLVLDEARERLYVLTRFDNAVSVLDLARRSEIAHVPLYNPEPPQVVAGRPLLYDASSTSSNGEASCAACHVFAQFDSLAWDLGNPDGFVLPNTNPGPLGPGRTFHPLKGPMSTQTLRGLAHHGPMHWRGDRTGALAEPPGDALDEVLAFEAFNPAFESLLGRDAGPISPAEMRAFADFALEITMPPNPIRNLDNVLDSFSAGGMRSFFGPRPAPCPTCHAVEPGQGMFGTGGEMAFEGFTQEFKIPQLRNLYQKVGMFGVAGVSNPTMSPGSPAPTGPQIRGFGIFNDGGVDTVFRGFRFRNLEAFVMRFPTTLAPIVGQQLTLGAANADVAGPRIDLLLERAAAPFELVDHPGATECELVVKGNVAGRSRGWLLDAAGEFVPDRLTEPPLRDAELRSLASTPGQELTYTCAPPGSGVRMALDRDEDGVFDGDDNCPSHLNPEQGDANGNGVGDACEAAVCATPRTACHAASRARLSLQVLPGGNGRLVWKWSQPKTAGPTGDPDATNDFALCVFEGDAERTLLEAAVPAGSGWTRHGETRRFRSPNADGIRRISLRPGARGRAKAYVRASGPSLALPSPLSVELPLRVQLQSRGGECWEARYEASSVIRALPKRLEAQILAPPKGKKPKGS